MTSSSRQSLDDSVRQDQKFQRNTGIMRLVGENNSSVYSATDDAVYVGPVSGCANFADADVDAMYRQ